MPGFAPEPPDAPDPSVLDVRAPGPIADRDEIESCVLNDAGGASIAARGVTLTSVRVQGPALLSSVMGALRGIDCVVERADCSGATWIDARLVRCLFEGCKATGLDLRGGGLRDVRFSDCKLPDAFMHEATLDRVLFERCQMPGLDLSGATIVSMSIRDCDARNLRLMGARIDSLDLRGSRIEGLAIEPGSVSKLTIDPIQAPALAQALGARVLGVGDDSSHRGEGL